MTQIITSRGGGQGGGGGGDGDMKKAVYDPQNIGKDAFDYDNFTNTPTIPTEVSELDNDAGYITSAALSGYQTTSNLVTNLTNPDDTHYPSAKAVSDAITSSGGGDMLKSVYDPNNVNANAFDYNNFINTPTIPTNSDYVDLSTNQTVGGTKTFTTSPVVPSKSTDATNTATAISTEAQVYKKQDKLTTQTAYTSKGTATKVPTITTNTLGQVTGITETDISFPVTSVNGSTGAVTVNDVKIASSAPTASDGKVWYDTTNHYLKYYEDLGGGDASWVTVQEKLASQTAYTSKGTYSKVPQITTNSLGQVTGITEVNISHPSQVSDIAYAASWDGVTTTAPSKNAVYDKISAMDTTISGKQDTLSTQTAYTSKGTATKVPTITTNTLGQVTGISETDITFPVTSVNGQTGAVTISEGNTKTFYASTSSQWNTTLGQQVYDWIKSGNYAILQYGIQNVVIFTPTSTTTGSIYSQGYYTVRGSGDELESVATTYGITVSSGTVTAVDSSPTVSSVGYFFAPSGTATTGYVVTKTANGYEWAAPTGGIQLAPNTELDIKYHWYGSQASYDSLNQYYTDTAGDTAYFTVA